MSFMESNSHDLSKYWVLLDSCLCGNLIADKSLLHDIHQVENPLTIYCNAATIILDHMGYFGSYPELVWYNPQGTANIMSLANVSKYYQIKMDTSAENCITLIETNQNTISFTLTTMGLCCHQLALEQALLLFHQLKVPRNGT